MPLPGVDRVGGDFWDKNVPQYTAPSRSRRWGKNALSARTGIRDVGLKKSTTLSYVFDFGDEWRLALEVVETWPAEEAAYRMLVPGEGIPPPQYPDLDETEDET